MIFLSLNIGHPFHRLPPSTAPKKVDFLWKSVVKKIPVTNERDRSGVTIALQALSQS